MSAKDQLVSRERMAIFGDLDVAVFLPWIDRHASKLGLTKRITHADNQQIELEIEGPIVLIDAMEVGCSLGPYGVWVETVKRSALKDTAT